MRLNDFLSLFLLRLFPPILVFLLFFYITTQRQESKQDLLSLIGMYTRIHQVLFFSSSLDMVYGFFFFLGSLERLSEIEKKM